MMFQKATKTKAKARIALMGPSGSGKTYTALEIAGGLGKRIALIDSEHGSASKYADKFEFDTVSLTTFSPREYIKHVQGAKDYDVLIIDSISHEWAGKGGCLEMIDKITESSNSKNSYTSWGKVTPEHNSFVDALLQSPCHLIATMRTKHDYVLETNDKGKTTPKKIGLAPIQRDGVEFEFDIVGMMDLDHVLRIEKTRCSELDGGVFPQPSKVLGECIAEWLDQGIEATAEQSDKALVNDTQFEELKNINKAIGSNDRELWTMIKNSYPEVDSHNFKTTFTQEMYDNLLKQLKALDGAAIKT